MQGGRANLAIAAISLALVAGCATAGDDRVVMECDLISWSLVGSLVEGYGQDDVEDLERTIRPHSGDFLITSEPTPEGLRPGDFHVTSSCEVPQGSCVALRQALDGKPYVATLAECSMEG